MNSTPFWYWVILFISVATPLVSAFMNNKHAHDMKEMELFQTRKLDRQETYIREVNRCVHARRITEEFLAIRDSIHLYVPRECFDIVYEINTDLDLDDYERAASAVRDLCLLLEEIRSKPSATANVIRKIGRAVKRKKHK